MKTLSLLVLAGALAAGPALALDNPPVASQNRSIAQDFNMEGARSNAPWSDVSLNMNGLPANASAYGEPAADTRSECYISPQTPSAYCKDFIQTRN